MKLYLCHGVTFAGTQADAKKLDKYFIPTEVPTDKEKLIAYLNEFGRMNRAAGRNDAEEASSISRVPDAEIAQRNDGDAQREATRRMVPAEGFNVTLTGVEAFIQSAGHPQVASIFENCVYRARELVEAPPAPGSLQEKMAAVASEARDAKGRPQTTAETAEPEDLPNTMIQPEEEIDPLA